MLGQRSRDENALVEPPFSQTARVHGNREKDIKTVPGEIAMVLSLVKKAKGGCQMQLSALLEVEDRFAKVARVHGTGTYGGEGTGAGSG